MIAKKKYQSFDRTRRAGILLHPTSLPESIGNGDFGHEAYRFIEFLNSCGFKVWQMLPLGPTHKEKSPYQCLSSHAGNPLLISLDWLVDKGWLNKDKVDKTLTDDDYRKTCLQQAGENFYQLDEQEWTIKISGFSKQHDYWLDDYALFIAFKSIYKNKPWYEWPAAARHRTEEAVSEVRSELKNNIKQTIFEQFVFFTQWHEIREYAKKHKVELFGDMPIFVAKDSADVWAKRENFLMDVDGNMPLVSGVPPDAFSDSGQRWGNPLYDWKYMQSTQFNWWKERFKTQIELFDIVRIDHFRGLQACWTIPFNEDTAINGEWVEVPGQEMLNELYQSFENLPLVAEDLGVITKPVIELKESFNLPGMKVLQFAFDGNNANPHLPHHHEVTDVIYTGTHDNDTSLGWLEKDSKYNKKYFEEYTGVKIKKTKKDVCTMIRMAMASVSFLSVFPFQDILMLDSSARMNTPGTVGDNWLWRFQWKQVKPEINEKLNRMIKVYQR
ncbi:MAG: 4-alpha-glucanotransferase [Gammaproteobacteria bacterium]|nr:4-alpha-glucanotransferase [Gammaproteobacteria bacterium]MCW8986233.1 4-alpha-glucanotransferase [Gammaproteobacteria bacterium]